MDFMFSIWSLKLWLSFWFGYHIIVLTHKCFEEKHKYFKKITVYNSLPGAIPPNLLQHFSYKGKYISKFDDVS